MSIINEGYTIQKPLNHCLLCGSDIVETERHPSMIEIDDADSTRKDYCFNCWSKLADRKFFSFWIAKRIKPGPDKRANKKERNMSLVQLFLSLYNSPERYKFKAHLFLLAHFLMRYQVLKWKDTKTEEDIENNPDLAAVIETIFAIPETGILKSHRDITHTDGLENTGAPSSQQEEATAAAVLPEESAKTNTEASPAQEPATEQEAAAETTAAVSAENEASPEDEQKDVPPQESAAQEKPVNPAEIAEEETEENEIQPDISPTVPKSYIFFTQKGTGEEYIIEDMPLEDESLIEIKKEIDAALTGYEPKEQNDEN